MSRVWGVNIFTGKDLGVRYIHLFTHGHIDNLILTMRLEFRIFNHRPVLF